MSSRFGGRDEADIAAGGREGEAEETETRAAHRTV
jgi:hypothetical protein